MAVLFLGCIMFGPVILFPALILIMQLSFLYVLSRGPGCWIFNTSLLKEPDFVQEVVAFWASWVLRKPPSSLQRWCDRGKMRQKGLAIRFSSSCRAHREDLRPMLTSLAGHLKAQIDNGRVSLLDTYEGVLHQIALLHRVAPEGARLRARVRWAEEGEMSSRFFLRQERKRGASGWLAATRCADGSLATDISSICESWVDFYSGLFTADPVDSPAQDSLLGCLTARLPGEARDSCDGLLSTEEVFKAVEGKAVEGMASEKAPGSDGLPAEFYRAFWHVLGAD